MSEPINKDIEYSINIEKIVKEKKKTVPDYDKGQLAEEIGIGAQSIYNIDSPNQKNPNWIGYIARLLIVAGIPLPDFIEANPKKKKP